MAPWFDLSAEQIHQWLAERHLPGFRAAQVRHWLFRRPGRSFDDMTDLPAAAPRPTGRRLPDLDHAASPPIASADDGTEKLLLGLTDGEQIECVLLRDDRQHRTICISTQVGCAMGCVFCASGLDGVVRNLTAGEIVEQMLQLAAAAAGRRTPQPHRGDGHGRAAGESRRLAAGPGRGRSPPGWASAPGGSPSPPSALPAGIRRLADEKCQYHLAVSLHAADDALRNQLVPANRKVGIAAILAAADEYFERPAAG